MKYHWADFGFSTADAESVEVHFSGSSLILTFVDWQGANIKFTFEDVIAFKWEDDLDEPTVKDDICYEVEDSTWLHRKSSQDSAISIEEYGHYKLCFNEYGAALDILCKRPSRIKIRS